MSTGIIKEAKIPPHSSMLSGISASLILTLNSHPGPIPTPHPPWRYMLTSSSSPSFLLGSRAIVMSEPTLHITVQVCLNGYMMYCSGGYPIKDICIPISAGLERAAPVTRIRFSSIAFSSVVALHKMVLLSPSCVASKVLEVPLQCHPQQVLLRYFDTKVLAQLGILAHALPPSRARSVAFATFSMGAPVGGAFSMIIDDVLTRLSSCVMITDTHYHIGALYFTWLPLIETSVGLVLMVFVLAQGEIASDGWKTPHIIALLIVGVIMLALFLVWE
ncbi:uncharacterized protein BJ212DRAFT_1297366 [Suillus subaureus]|uniref:Uncharacterized protein n=1 Tax=Suillus subaureus TaxID=48587 RepID=A0A9P7JFZ0_9AGAM|nr:uncharacterized protein BJ212DRAFT_1297366 [Suillus subaureus]KAG1820869.1 hypothetical protein BJ212DRAFT_1297366 [Suillus subaureus]